MLSFIKSFIGKEVAQSEALNLIDNSIYFQIIALLLLAGVVIFLFIYKKKPRFIYYLTTIGYIIILVITSLTYNYFEVISEGLSTAKVLLLYRDILRIATWYQYFILVCMFVRAIGFDIKKFNFKEDLMDLQVDEKDNEEIEVSIGLDSNLIERGRRKKLRQLKYYYLENKLFVNISLAAIFVFLISGIFSGTQSATKYYAENTAVQSSYYQLNVVNSFVTNKSDLGQTIIDDDTGFLIVKINVKSLNEYKYKLNTDYFVAEINGKIYLPSKKYYNYFSQTGVGYKNQYITSEAKDYLFIYKIPSNTFRSDIKFIYQGRYEKGVDVNVRLSPVNLDGEIPMETYNLGETMDFSKSILGKTNLTMTEYTTGKKFEYNYCYLEDCNYSSVLYSPYETILKIPITESLTNSLLKQIADNYITVKYIYNDQELTSSVFRDQIPPGTTDCLYLEVDKEVEEATKIWLEFKVRSQIYTYNLK